VLIRLETDATTTVIRAITPPRSPSGRPPSQVVPSQLIDELGRALPGVRVVPWWLPPPRARSPATVCVPWHSARTPLLALQGPLAVLSGDRHRHGVGSRLVPSVLGRRTRVHDGRSEGVQVTVMYTGHLAVDEARERRLLQPVGFGTHTV